MNRRTKGNRRPSALQLAQQEEALGRARGGACERNDLIVIMGFNAMGIDDAQPRVNCFTFNAWKALGRQVKKRPADIEKGAYGVSITTWIPIKDKAGNKQTGEDGRTKLRQKSATIFHFSQTEPIGKLEALSA